MLEIEEALAAGIFRGEGYIGCRLRSLVYPSGRYAEISADVKMCDRDSVEIVAKVWGSRVYCSVPGSVEEVRPNITHKLQDCIASERKSEGGLQQVS